MKDIIFSSTIPFCHYFRATRSLHHIIPWTGAKQPIKSFPFDMLAAWVVLTWQKTFLIWTSSSASLSRPYLFAVFCVLGLWLSRDHSVWCSPWQALSWDQYLKMYFSFPVHQWNKLLLAHCFPFGLLTFSLHPPPAQLHTCLQPALTQGIGFDAWSQIAYASNPISANWHNTQKPPKLQLKTIQKAVCRAWAWLDSRCPPRLHCISLPQMGKGEKNNKKVHESR